MPSFYESAIPAYLRGLKGLMAILDRAAAQTGKEPADVLLTSLSATDGLKPLGQQVMRAALRATEDPLLALGRVEEAEAIHEAAHDDEGVAALKAKPDYDSLESHVADAIKFLRGIDPVEFDAAADNHVNVGHERKANVTPTPATEFIFLRSLPRFYFHCSTVYLGFRNNGVHLRKPDFLGGQSTG